MSDNEWKSDFAVMLPMVVLFIAMGAACVVKSFMDGKIEIERLRLAQMQYSAEWNTQKPEDRDE